MLPVETRQIYDILVTILGNSKQGGFNTNETQYQFNSPWCTVENGGIPDMKYNLEVSFSLGKFHDWSTNHGGNLSKLIKRWGTSELLNSYFETVKSLNESKYYELDLFKDTENNFYGIENNVLLPQTFTKIDLSKCRKNKLVEYLKERNITQDIIDKYNLGYTTWDEELWQDRDRLIIPSYDINGDLNYWVGRDFTKNPKKVKYKNCNVDKKNIIFQEDKIKWCSDIWLCEGAIDCIYGNGNTVSLLGKVLTKDSELYKKIKEKAKANVIICLDGDVDVSEIKKIYRLVSDELSRDKVWYVRLGTDELPWKDFGEAYQNGGKENMIKIMKSKKHFHDMDLDF